MLVQCNRVQAQTHNLLTLQGVCKHIQLWSRVKEEQSITLTRDSRALHLEVTQSVARVVRKRESSKPRTDATRNETLLSAIPVTGDISSKALLELLSQHPSHPPSGRVTLQDGTATAAAESAPKDCIMVGASDNSEEESDNQWVPPRLSSLSGYTDSELERGSIVEFWWPTKKFVGVITRRPTADEPIDQITGHHRNQATILHRPSAYVIEFEDREVHILCLPTELRYGGDSRVNNRRGVNDWALLSGLPRDCPNLAAMVAKMQVPTVTGTIAPLVLRAEPGTAEFTFSAATPLGITFVLDAAGNVCIHSFCQQPDGSPGPAPYTVSMSHRDLHARDVVVQVNLSPCKLCPHLTQTHARTLSQK